MNALSSIHTAALRTGLAIVLAAGLATAQEGGAFEKAAAKLQGQLDDGLARLSALYEQIAAEKIPLSQELGRLEADYSAVRLRFDERQSVLDSRNLDLNNLRGEIKQRKDEASFLAGLLGEYVRNFQSRLHIVELQRYEGVLETATLAADSADVTDASVFAAQLAVVDTSFDRLEDALGGVLFKGTAIDPKRLVEEGTIALIGPAALFVSDDGKQVGTAEQRLGSLQPAVIGFENPEIATAAVEFFESGLGGFPMDPTLGNAHKIEAIQQSVFDEFQKGGAVMWPILVMAGIALLVALYKWVTLSLVPKPSQRQINGLLDAVDTLDVAEAQSRARAMKGPMGRMFVKAAAHLREPKELVEEVMYESVLTTKLKVNGLLPFIAICAASAPLLGLLGTVTGIISTFENIQIYGTGDAKTLSGGISEALITTKYGLVVAIPSLLLHAYLSRKARGIVGDMETGALAFVNRMSAAAERREQRRSVAGPQPAASGALPPDPDLVREQVAVILEEMLGDVARSSNHAERLAARGDRD